MKQIQQNPDADINWNEVQKQIYRNNYMDRTLSPEGATIVAIVIAVVTAGSGSAISASIIGAAQAAVVSAAITKAATTFINNGGKLDNTLDDLGSKEGLRELAISLAAAAATAGIAEEIGRVFEGSNLSFGEYFTNELVSGLAATSITSAINAAASGESIDDFDNLLEDYLKEGVKTVTIDALAASISHEIGKASRSTETPINKSEQLISHFATGCLIGEIKTDGGCGSGAFGALIGEAIALEFKEDFEAEKRYIENQKKEGLLSNDDTLLRVIEAAERFELDSDIASLASALTVGASGGDVDVASSASSNAVDNNLCGTGLCALAVAWVASEVFDFVVESARENNEAIDNAFNSVEEYRESLLSKLTLPPKIEQKFNQAWNKLPIEAQAMIVAGSEIASEVFPATKKVKGGSSGNKDKSKSVHKTYVIIDKSTDKVIYVGRSKNCVQRCTAHALSTRFKNLGVKGLADFTGKYEFREVGKGIEAEGRKVPEQIRFREQALMEYYGGKENLYNIANAVAPAAKTKVKNKFEDATKYVLELAAQNKLPPKPKVGK